jgi:putative membrane protein
MSMMRITSLLAATVVLATAWLGPLPDLAARSFAAHMTMHMAVVAVAAPLMAIAIAGSALDPARARPRLFAPVPASIIELVVVWAWHVPVLHHAARGQPGALIVEQASFLVAGLLLWIAAVGGTRAHHRFRAGPGIVALLFTSMHMTLLGALFALATRPLFEHAIRAEGVPAALADQHLGGAIMLLVGGASYLAGGLWLTAGMVRAPALSGRSESKGPSLRRKVAS